MNTLIRSLVVGRAWWLALWLAGGVVAAFFLRASLAEIHQHSVGTATEGARNVFRMLVVMRQWNARHAGVYVPLGEDVPPNPYLRQPRRDVRTVDGQTLTLVNPAYMTRMISEMTHLSEGVSFRSVSLKPLNPGNAPDEWERAALLRLEQDGGRAASEVGELTTLDGGQPVFRYLAPLRVSAECLSCHLEQGYAVGDLRGGISIKLDYAPFLAAALPSERTTLQAHIAVWLSLVLLSAWGLAQLRISWLALENNIEELKRTRDELLQSEKMASLGRMVAGFAHELNTPVGVAVGAVSHNAHALDRVDALLCGEEVDEAALREQLASLRSGGELALSNLQRASSLVQRFKRSSIDQASEQRRVFSVMETIDDIRFSLQNQLKRGPVNLEVDCPADLRVNGIPGLLEQVLTNLVMNSVQHGFVDGAQSGNIRIAVSVRGEGRLHVVYADDGRGMAEEVVARIFEPFFTTRRGSGGSGLGMFLCYNIVTVELAGTIQCSSAPGKGVRFEIEFPCELAGEGEVA